MLQFTLELLDFSSVDKPTVIIVNTKASTSKIINVNIIIIPHVHNIIHNIIASRSNNYYHIFKIIIYKSQHYILQFMVNIKFEAQCPLQDTSIS